MCRWILLTHDRTGNEGFGLTQEYLSLMLGVRRATVSTIAHKLKQEGLINYKRGRLVVTDRRKLEDCSSECYGLISDLTARTLAHHG